jgi:hypothetical protein
MKLFTKPQKQPVKRYCDVGHHEVVNTWVGVCIVCERRVCPAHQGNPEVPAGSYIACPLHVEEVAHLNRAWTERLSHLGLLSFGEEEGTKDAD